ncbi:MAG TPA: hypothetical protein VFS37_07505, partial [Conexibacter sp.]|nr:hypothetical protein [Conexibacter sp.]
FAWVALGGNLSNLSSPEAIAAFAVLIAMGVGGLVVASRDVAVRRRLRAVRDRNPAGDVTPSGSGTGTSSPDGRSAGRP